MILINNAHYRLEIGWKLNAEGGSNPGGKTVIICQKRTKATIEIPLRLFINFFYRIQRHL